MQAVQVGFPNQVPMRGSAPLPWRPAPARPMGWQPARPRVGPHVGQVSISESARVAGSIIVGVAAGVAGALLAFSGTEDKPRPILKGVGWAVLGLGVLAVGVNFLRVVSPPAVEEVAVQP